MITRLPSFQFHIHMHKNNLFQQNRIQLTLKGVKIAKLLVTGKDIIEIFR